MSDRRLQDSIDAWSDASNHAVETETAARLAGEQAELAALVARESAKQVAADLESVGGVAVRVVDDFTAILFTTAPGTDAGFEFKTIPLTNILVTPASPDPIDETA